MVRRSDVMCSGPEPFPICCALCWPRWVVVEWGGNGGCERFHEVAVTGCIEDGPFLRGGGRLPRNGPRRILRS
jgi:hypothetical protein